MFARIEDCRVVAKANSREELLSGALTQVEEVFEWDVQVGWLWTPQGCAPPTAPTPDPYALDPEYLNLSAISIGHAERLYAAAQAEAAQVDAQGNPGDGPATVLLEMLGL